MEHTEGGGVYIWDGGGDRLSWWGDNVANITLGTETNALLDYATGLEHQYPMISTLGETGGQWERYSILVQTPIGQNKTLYKMMEPQLVILLWIITP